jgi:hypothetical protein
MGAGQPWPRGDRLRVLWQDPSDLCTVAARAAILGLIEFRNPDHENPYTIGPAEAGLWPRPKVAALAIRLT